MKQAKNNKLIFNIFAITLLILVGLSFVKSIFVSFDMDEGYALSQGIRLAMGDHLFKEMWEPHQLSAYPIAILAKIFLTITGGSSTGIIIFLRVFGCLIHAGLGYLLYLALKSYVSKNVSLILSLIHCLYLPKWVQLPEFELMQYWNLLLVFICLTTAYKKQKMKVAMLILAGVFTLLQMTSYPTMCILFIPAIIAIRKNSFTKLKDCLICSAGFFGSGILVLIYIFAFITPSEFMRNLKFIFMDESHTTETGLSKLLLYKDQVLGSLLLNIVAIFVAFFIVAIIMCLIKRLDFNSYFKEIVLNSLITSCGLLLVADLVAVAFFDVNIFVFTHFYISFIILGIFLYFAYPNKRLGLPYISLFLSGILSVVAISIMTNMSLNVIISHAFPSILAVIIYLASINNGKKTRKDYTKAFATFTVVALILTLLFSRLIAIRVNGCLPVTIRAGLERMERGPLAGLYVVDDDAYIYNGLMDLVDEYEASDRLLYIGGETWIYSYKPSTVCSASVQGTSSYNEAFIEYYSFYDKLPAVVMYDTSLGENPAYNTTTVNDEMLEFIKNNYSNIEDKNFAIIYTP